MLFACTVALRRRQVRNRDVNVLFRLSASLFAVADVAALQRAGGLQLAGVAGHRRVDDRSALQRLPDDLADPLERRAFQMQRQVGGAGVVERDVALAGDVQVGPGNRSLRQVPFPVGVGAVDDRACRSQACQSCELARSTRPVASMESTVTPVA